MQINTKFNVGDLVYHIYTTVTCEEIGDGTYYKPIWIKNIEPILIDDINILIESERICIMYGSYKPLRYFEKDCFLTLELADQECVKRNKGYYV